MNNKDDIKNLIEKFYSGTTTDAEEKLLKLYFSGNDIADELKSEQKLFLALCPSEVSIPDDLQERVERRIDQWNVIDTTARRRVTRIGLRWVMGVAASLLLLFTAGIMIYHHESEAQTSQMETIDTYENPEDAYAETNRALTKFSRSLNKGLEKVENITNHQID
ncbi:hypothetical protein ETF27_06025 [Prevotella brunnea]|uniref:Uncharacterized protein n=1 Tax=Prevotella brunnea TaxID=2508867 RepID=A0A5C8GMX3_9BACT|nr:hypothetical protein [Prevotella brunnea]TXJ62119.1 hypothetical protein ETF27_06025 [Prevotella brunnea]